MADALKHTLTTDVDGIVKILRPALALPGWSEDFYLMYAAGVVLEMPEMTAEYKVSTQDECRQPVVLTLSEKQRDACKACLNHFRDKKSLPTGSHLNKLLVGLGLVDPSKV